MTIKEIKVNDYVTASKLPASDYVINPYVGCPHACKYCYASFMKRFTNHPEAWGEFLDVKKCDKKISSKKLTGKTVFLASVTDCYNLYEEKYEITREILKQLVDIDCKLTISTKSKLVLRDIDLLRKMKDVEVAISMNTLDENFKEDMDKASSIKERIETLKVLYENHIKTVLFMSPIFPGVTDFKSIITRTKNFVDVYWFENLNLRAGYKSFVLEYIKEHYPEYSNLYDKIYIQKDNSYWEELSFEIDAFCRREEVSFVNFFYHEKIRKK